MSSTGISDTGDTNIYYALDALLLKLDPSVPRVHMVTANGHIARSSATAEAATPQLAHNFSTMGYVMPNFKYTILGIDPIYDAGCKAAFSAQDVEFFAPNGRDILKGWREYAGAKLWRFAFIPHYNQLPLTQWDTQKSMM